ncbi:hypothetical protein TBLA_0B03700 [Henningerozyma blattae CBS 6284]|uniref:Cytochrome b5 heme-binding domain-containing protein n=1 Tax=Henningerozyma blattae (strain ATCC 34711 / CBS 6284 / DSM 70876 / NBRC 10599 / NRRL Y-10934 / UCD 77-7) TaxID=1071380 RepID=I2GYK7_HENB6|nr:hypothetical protein TBLA_0B03700 [Tetrapisispora blattae CBS 6284]CCH59209.1 hypothetical protein TBLA_0B03700 [Tetrapisispora blattae CBS 6284]
MSFFNMFLGGGVKTSDDPTGFAGGDGGDTFNQNGQEPIVHAEFYPRTLLQFNGINDPRIFLGICGKVYDCTSGAQFYGPGGPYENFAGHDASRGLALNSFDPSVIREWDQPMDELKDLDESQVEALQSWVDFFDNKYPIVGTLVPEPGINTVD